MPDAAARVSCRLPPAAASLLQSGVMIQGIEHTAVASPDPDRLANFYVQYLDFTVNYHSEKSRTYFVRTKDHSMLEIILADTAPQPQNFTEAGLRHLALTTDDFDADYARLKAAKVKFLTEAEVRGGNRVVFFHDPDGNIVHLIQRPEPLP